VVAVDAGPMQIQLGEGNLRFAKAVLEAQGIMGRALEIGYGDADDIGHLQRRPAHLLLVWGLVV